MNKKGRINTINNLVIIIAISITKFLLPIPIDIHDMCHNYNLYATEIHIREIKYIALVQYLITIYNHCF